MILPNHVRECSSTVLLIINIYVALKSFVVPSSPSGETDFGACVVHRGKAL